MKPSCVLFRFALIPVVLVATLLPGGCVSDAADPSIDGGTTTMPDQSRPDEGGPLPEAIKQCEAALAADWMAHPPVVGISPPSSLDSYVKVIGKVMSDFDVPGGTVAVTKNGKLAMAIGIGFSDVDGLQPAHPDQLFRIASLSKQITASAVLRLVAEGKLKLDDHPFEILADLQPLPGKSIHPSLAQVTVRHLLNHTGGWNRDFEKVGDPMFASFAISSALGKPGPASCEDTIRYMLDKAPTYAPGSTYCYSNFGYCVLGRVIERRSAMGYESYVKSAWLNPAGATRMRLGKTLLADRADDEVLYYGYPGEHMGTSIFPSMPGLVPQEYGAWAIEAMDAHGGWISSVVDSLHSQLASDGQMSPPDLIDANALAQMLGNPDVPSCDGKGGTVPADAGYWYGFGWSVNKYGNHWHTGALSGTATEDATLANGYSWAAYFNSRPRDGAFYGRLDGDLWNAWGPVQMANGFSSEDWFDQFPPDGFASWMDAGVFEDQWRSQRAQGLYPMRIEGHLHLGKTEYRAEWAPLHTSMKNEAVIGMDCIAYRAKDSALRAQGYLPISIQSYQKADGLRSFQASWAHYQ